MTDMLVKLYQLPPYEAEIAKLAEGGIQIRRAITPEKHFAVNWVRKNFNEEWASEIDAAISRSPVTCWLAVEKETMVGFSCFDTSAKGFFGPIGVSDTVRGRGVGRALLLVCLHNMHMEGYGYAIIGGIGPAEFYQKTVGATIIEDSTPGVYKDMLNQ